MIIRDRLVLNPEQFFIWTVRRFGISTPEEAEARISEIDPLAELLIIDGVEHRIPHSCYYSLGLEWGDDRPEVEPCGPG